MDSSRTNQTIFRNLDWITIIIYLLLVAAGAVSIYAASYNFDNASIFDMSAFSGKQIQWIGVSLVVGFALLLIDARMYETYAYPIYIGMLLLLVVTIFIAPDIKGSRSWIAFGSFSIQPAEFAKFATALALAKLLGAYGFRLNAKPINYVKALAIIFLPIILILAQRETGSALVYLSLFFVLYREGMSGLILLAALFAVVIFVVSVKYTTTMLFGVTTGEFVVYMLILATLLAMVLIYCRDLRIGRNVLYGYIGGVVVICVLSLTGLVQPGGWFYIGLIGLTCVYLMIEFMRAPLHKLLVTVATAILALSFMFSVSYVFNNVLGDHQQMRIKVTLGLEEDLRGGGYNVNQSKIAIGSGGWSGKGFLNGTQTKLKYVPEQHTDFIFCTIGEEEGFVGTIAVVAAFVLLIIRIINIAERQPSTFNRVYAYCVASILIFHFCINIGMVIGLCPVIGIPLPFFSYGGSSLLGFTVLLFIMLRLDASRYNKIF